MSSASDSDNDKSSESDGGRSEPDTFTVLCDCTKLNVHGQTFITRSDEVIFCQALDRLEDVSVGCVRQANQLNLYRVSPQNKLSIFCDSHLTRLKLHQCCPYCGEFCTQGKNTLVCSGDDSQCLRSEDSLDVIYHLFHKYCAMTHAKMVNVLNNSAESVMSEDIIKCPHCGYAGRKMFHTVNLRVEAEELPIFYSQPQRFDPKPLLELEDSPTPAKRRKESEFALAEVASTVSIVPFEADILHLIDDEFASELESLMQRAADLQSTDWEIRTDNLEQLLLSAVEKWDMAELIALMLKGRFEVDMKFESRNGKTLLHLSVESKQMCFIYSIVSMEPDFEVFDDDDQTPLMLAAKLDIPAIVGYLIAAGANEHTSSPNTGYNVLHVAVAHEKLTTVQQLVKGYPKLINSKESKDGLTALMIAARERFTEIVAYLIERQCDTHILDNNKNSALHWAVYGGSLGVVTTLLRSGALINSKNTLGETPLDISIQQNREMVMYALLSNNADIEASKTISNIPAQGADRSSGQKVLLAVLKQRRLYSMSRKRTGTSGSKGGGEECNKIKRIKSEDDAI